jgi:flagellar biosynthesis/type III secretory pathway M-ring protein FliF/YscJ
MAVAVSLIVLFFWMVPESVRYLVSQKRYEEADKIFKKIAQSNNKVYLSFFKYIT